MTQTAIRYAPLLGALFAVLAICAPRSSTAQEDEIVLDEIGEMLAVAVAQVAMNEAPGFPADEALIWQATRTHGSTSAEQLAWLRAHSSCVLTDRPMRAREVVAGNCRWTRHLAEPRADGEPPLGWPGHWPWTARWEAHWLGTLDHARRFVSGERPRNWPCAETPRTWGGDMDASGAADRGLVPIACVDHRTGRPTENTGYRPARTRARLAE